MLNILTKNEKPSVLSMEWNADWTIEIVIYLETSRAKEIENIRTRNMKNHEPEWFQCRVT